METFSQDVVLKRIFRQKLLLLTLIAIGIPSSLESGISRKDKNDKAIRYFYTLTSLNSLLCFFSLSQCIFFGSFRDVSIEILKLFHVVKCSFNEFRRCEDICLH